MKKKFALILALALFCGLVTGCNTTGSPKAKETVHLTVKLPILVMAPLNDPECTDTSTFLRKALDLFTAKYDKYAVEADIVLFEQTEYQEQIVNCYGTVNAADLMFGGYFAMSGYIYDGYAIPFDDILTDAIRSDFSESSWSQSRGYNGKTYLMPFFALQNILCFNQDLFRQCGLEKYCREDQKIQGWSLEEWEYILSTLKEKLPAGTFPMMMYAGSNQGDTHTMIQLRCMGSSFFDGQGLFNLNTPEGIAGLQWLKDNYDKGYYPANCEHMEISDCLNLFLNGQLAVYVFNSASRDYTEQVDMGFVNFPGASKAGVNSNWISGFMAFDNGDPKKVEVVRDLVKFIYETPELMAYSTGGIPCSRSVAEEYGDRIFMTRQFQENEINTVEFTANNPNWSDVRAAFYPHIDALLSGEETAEECAAGLDTDCNTAITANERKLHD